MITSYLNGETEDMRKSILLQSMSQSDLYHHITRILKQKFGTLPKSGIFAGQAVASAVYSILEITHLAPYNDLDVFGTEDELPKGIFGNNRYKPLFSRKNGDQSVSLYEGSFSYNVGVIDVGSYSIEDSTVAPDNFKINYVKINPRNTKKTTGFGKHILKGFDINCVQVGVDAQTKEVFWTPEFLEFLDSRVLEVNFYGTPMHSAVRLLKKKQALPWASLDTQSQMRKLQTVRQLIKLVEDERSTEHATMVFPGNLFSEIYRARAAEHENVLSEYFSMDYRTLNLYRSETKKSESVTFYLLQPTGHNEEAINDFIDLLAAAGSTIGEAYQFNSIEFLIRLFTKFQEAKSRDNWNDIKDTLYKFMNKNTEKKADIALLFMHINETLFDPNWEKEAQQLNADDFYSINTMITDFTQTFNLARGRGLAFTSRVANSIRAVSKMKARYLAIMLNGGGEDLTPPDVLDIKNIDNWANPLFIKVITPYIESEQQKMEETPLPFINDDKWLSELSSDDFKLIKYQNVAELHSAIDPHHWSASVMVNTERTYLPIGFACKHERGEKKGVFVLRNYSSQEANGQTLYHWGIADILFEKGELTNNEHNKLYEHFHDSMGKKILKHLKDNSIVFMIPKSNS
jgi:hypothetical protein